jgi:hypothetical protein
VFAEICSDEIVTSLKLLPQIGDSAGKRNDVLAN